MQPVALTVFELFRQRAEKSGVYPHRGDADTINASFRRQIADWAADYVLETHHYPDKAFDKLWVCQPVFHSTKDRLDTSSYNRKNHYRAFLVALNPRTGQILAFDIEIRKHDLGDLRNKPHRVFMSLSAADELPDIGIMASFLGNMPRAGADKLTNQTYAKDAPRGKNSETKLRRRLLWQAANDTLEAEMQPFMDAIWAHVDKEILIESRQLARTPEQGRPHTPLEFYNLMITGATSRETDFRRGALRVLSRGEEFFYDDRAFWARVDSGLSIHQAIAETVGAPAAAVKHLYARPGLLQSDIGKSHTAMRTYLPYLAAIGLDYWPQFIHVPPEAKGLSPKQQHRIFGAQHLNGAAEVTSFIAVVEGAEIYAKAFSRDAKQVLKDWIRDAARQAEPCNRWQKAFDMRFGRHLARAAQAGSLNHYWKDRKYERALEYFSADVRGIADMKADINRRVILPLLLLECEKHGWCVLKTNALNNISAAIEHDIFARATPHDQLSASSYWHSTRVNFQQRFESIANTTAAAQWRSLVDDAYKMRVDGKEVILVPLASDMALKDEGRAMGHCVGGDAINCLKKGYHIFSVRDSEGNRGSTLTVAEAEPKDGVPQIRHAENSSTRNAPAPDWCKAAAVELMRRVNAGELSVDWGAIHASKAEFLKKEVDLTVGYDYHAEEQRDRIFNIYRALLPGAMPGKARATVAGLATHLNIEQRIVDFMAQPALQLEALGLQRLAERPADGGPAPAAAPRGPQ